MFTDLEESTLRWELDALDMQRVMNVHDEVLDRVVESHGGVVFKSTGDGIGAVFSSPTKAVSAAVMIQRQLQIVPWRSDRPRVRIGLHVGDIVPTRGDYYGAEVNRAARIMDAANGDQIAVSNAVAEFIEPERRSGCGEHELRGIGVEPIHLVLDAQLIDDQRPLRASLVPRVRLLPSEVGKSVGREREVTDLVELVRTNRLVTVLGAGGVGKTHVGLEAARRLEGEFADGAVFVELGSVRNDDDVAAFIAAALGARLQPGLDLLDSLVDYVDGRELLVVLDNCEHVLATLSVITSRLLAASDVVVLATSRAAFGSPYEQIYPLNPLGDLEGVELFNERARSRDPRVVPSNDEASNVLRICSAVGGIPLGIELAAAWVRVLALDDIADRLERSPDVGGARLFDADSRHQPGARHETLRSTIEWSYRQLSKREALLFDRVSVFMGGFSIEAAAAVCSGEGVAADEVAGILMALVDTSMVTVELAGRDRRFVLLRPLQLFGADNLIDRGEFDELSRRHAHHFVEAAKTASGHLVSEHERDVWTFFTTEWSNIREAFSRLRAVGETQVAAQLLLDLGWYSTLSLRSEAFAWADELLESDDAHLLDAKSSLLGLRAIHKYFLVAPDSRSDAEYGLELDESDPHGYCRIALGAVWVNNQHAEHESELWTNEWIASLTPESPMMSRLWAHGMRAFHLCVHDPQSPEAAENIAVIETIVAQSRARSAQVLAHWAKGMYLASVALPSNDMKNITAARDEWSAGRELAGSLADVHLVAHLITSLELHFTAGGGPVGDALELSRDALHRAHRHHYLAGTSHLFGVVAIVLTRVGRIDIGQRLLRVMMANGHPPRQNAIDALGPVETPDPSATLSIREAARLADIALLEALGDRL